MKGAKDERTEGKEQFSNIINSPYHASTCLTASLSDSSATAPSPNQRLLIKCLNDRFNVIQIRNRVKLLFPFRRMCSIDDEPLLAGASNTTLRVFHHPHSRSNAPDFLHDGLICRNAKFIIDGNCSRSVNRYHQFLNNRI